MLLQKADVAGDSAQQFLHAIRTEFKGTNVPRGLTDHFRLTAFLDFASFLGKGSGHRFDVQRTANWEMTCTDIGEFIPEYQGISFRIGLAGSLVFAPVLDDIDHEFVLLRIRGMREECGSTCYSYVYQIQFFVHVFYLLGKFK